MKKVKNNNSKISFSERKINSFKIQKNQILSKKEENKLIKKPISSNIKNNQDKIKETNIQTEMKSKINYINGNKINNIKENKVKEKKNDIIEEENNIKKKSEEIIDNKEAISINNDKENNSGNDNSNNDNNNDNANASNNELKGKEKDNNSYLKLSKEEINKLLKANKTIENKSHSNDNIILDNKLNFDKKNQLKILTDKKKSLFNEVDKIFQKKRYMNEASFNNLSQNNIFHKNIKNDYIKNLEKNENNILQKINLIEQAINNVNNVNNTSDEYKEKYNEFNKKYKELIIQNSKIYKKIRNDAEITLQKKMKEYELIEKEKIKKNNYELMEKIKNEKLLEKKRKKEINIEVAKNKIYINCYNKGGQKKNYLYFKMATSFDKKEEKLIKNQRNLKSKLIGDNEQKDNLRNDYLEKKKKEMEENINNLHQIWKERSDLLPKYKSPLYEKVLYSEENIKEKEKNKIENKKKLYYKKEKYSKEKIHLPPISNILRRDTKQKKNEFSKNFVKKKFNNLSTDNLKNIHKYINNINNKINSERNNLKERNLIKSYSDISIRKSENINNNNKGKIIIAISSNKLKNNRNPYDINYLEDLKKERLTNNKNEIKKTKFINNKNTNLDYMKGQIQLMEEKYNRDRELLKVKGGYINNQELGDKMNQLLVNSIKNKLDIIEKMNE